MKERGGCDKEAPDNWRFPKADCGEHFIFSLRIPAITPSPDSRRMVIGLVSARRIDEEVARRGSLAGEISDTVMEVLQEYELRFLRGGRKQ